jgi:hypothetical protein
MSARPFAEFASAGLGRSIADRFEQQVTNDPGHLAIRTGTHTLTYEQTESPSERDRRQILSRRGPGQEPPSRSCSRTTRR